MLDQKNVLGTKLQSCSKFPMTGFYRDGCCNTGQEDFGIHTVCIVATDEFLEFSRKAGNDLTTPMPQFDFPGLIEGDRWCLCALRWLEAYEAGKAPKVILEATNERTLDYIPLEALKEYSISTREFDFSE